MSTNYQAIPQADPLSNYIAHQKEIDQAIHASLESGKYIRGPQTKAFEQEFAEYLDRKSVV